VALYAAVDPGPRRQRTGMLPMVWGDPAAPTGSVARPRRVSPRISWPPVSR